MNQFASAISAGSEEHGEVVRECDSENFVSVHVSGELDALLFKVVLKEPTLVGAIVDGLVKRAPLHIINLIIFWTFNHTRRFWNFVVLFRVKNILSIVNLNVRELVFSLVEHTELLVTERELNLVCLDSHWAEVEFCQKISVLGIKDLHTFSGSRGKQKLGVLADVDTLA